MAWPRDNGSRGAALVRLIALWARKKHDPSESVRLAPFEPTRADLIKAVTEELVNIGL